MKILITGASGFLGSHLVGQWAKTAQIVAGIYSDNTWRLDYFSKSGVQFDRVQLDITNKNSIDLVLDKVRPDMIINCAAYGVYPNQTANDKLLDTNIKGAVHLYESAMSFETKRFVQIGSCFEYGHKIEPISETEPPNPTTNYGITKWTANQILLNLANTSKTELVIGRVFGLWGILENKNRIVPLLVNADLNGQTSLDVTLGEQIRDYTHVADAAHWIIAIAQTKELHREIINIGSGVGMTLKNFMNQILSHLNSPLQLNYGAIPYRPNEMMHLVCEDSKINTLVPNRLNHLNPKLFRERLEEMKSQPN